jgi:hypothetical protein
MKRTPIRKRRPGTRRGQPTAAEKEAVRRMAFERARGMCELRIDTTCQRGPLPWDGPLRVRGHLVHLRNRRMWGWGEQNVCWGCARCHVDLHHVKGVAIPKTYDELIARNRSVATARRRP